MDAEAVMANLQRLYDAIPREGVKAMKSAIEEVNAVRTSTMLNSVRADEAGAIVQIHTSTMYAHFVEDGRRAFSAKPGRWLHWDADVKGPEVFTKHVAAVTPRHFAAITKTNIEAFIASFS